MIKVGLTGGMGSGKTTVARIFEQLGIPVFFADDEAKKISDQSLEVKSALIALFGNEIYQQNTLNRKLLAQHIFSNPEHIKRVNAIIHPAVANAFTQWEHAQNAPYVLQEAAILFETGGYKRFDKNILVTAPKALRIARVAHRSGLSRIEILQRMQNQWLDNEKKHLADFIIINNGKKMLLPQVLAIHENIIRSTNSQS